MVGDGRQLGRLEMGRQDTHFLRETRGSVRSKVPANLRFGLAKAWNAFVSEHLAARYRALSSEERKQKGESVGSEVTGPGAVQLRAWLHAGSGVLESPSHLCLSDGSAPRDMPTPWRPPLSVGATAMQPQWRGNVPSLAQCAEALDLHSQPPIGQAWAACPVWKPESVPCAPQPPRGAYAAPPGRLGCSHQKKGKWTRGRPWHAGLRHRCACQGPVIICQNHSFFDEFLDS